MFLTELGFILYSLNQELKMIENIEWSLSCRNMQLELIFFFPPPSLTEYYEEKKNPIAWTVWWGFRSITLVNHWDS